MDKKPDFRDFIVDHPSCRAKVQEQHMDGALYTDFEKFLRSLRATSIARVYRPYLLGGAVGRNDKRRNVWAERADRIKAKGCKLFSVDPPLTGHKLTMFAAKQIGDIARGKAGHSKKGRPPVYEFTEAEWEIIAGIWTGRKYSNDAARLAAIEKRLGKVPGRTLLRNKLGSPHKGTDK
jgi:hypothetical protein